MSKIAITPQKTTSVAEKVLGASALYCADLSLRYARAMTILGIAYYAVRSMKHVGKIAPNFSKR